jgi:hypothetical protein
MPGLANLERDGEFFAHSRRLKRGWGGVRTSDKIIRKQIFAN